METQKNFSLKNHNTFGIEVLAAEYINISSIAQLKEVLASNVGRELFILGGGSNMLLTKNIDALVLHINLRGIKIINETENCAIVRAQSGENWHNFVVFTIENDLGGLENMSLIPGNVGTTPIQNIGAYGTEIKDTFVSCEAMNIATQEMRTFYNEECQFGYRESIFKNKIKGEYIITSVDFKLSRGEHKINTTYGDITAELAKNNIQNPGISNVSKAVISIRQSKLPDPRELGNSGSFFKNPIISKEKFKEVQAKFPDIRHFPISDTEVKVPAGWLIEQAGFKGKRFGNAGIHVNQALVLVNYGGATGTEILNLSQKIQKEIFDIFGIWIDAEVNII